MEAVTSHKQSMHLIINDPEMFAEYWFTNNAAQESLNNYLLAYHRELAMYNRHRLINSEKSIRGLSTQILTCAFEAYIEKRPLKYKNELKNVYLNQPENLEPLKQWLKAVTGQLLIDELHVMAHWIWLVKRNMAGKPVVHHIMPIITSPKQGGGKSTAVRMLYKPIEKLAVDLKIKQAVDERAYTLFASYLVGFFDEMAGADKVDSNDIKSTLSSEKLSYRPMRTNIQCQITNNCSFIGTSNNELYDNIKDTTGVRRFYPIYSLDKLNHDSINTVDYAALWKGVNENHPRGYMEEVQAIVNAKQASLQMREELQVFLEDNALLPERGGSTITVNGKALFHQYQKFSADAGLKFPLSAQTFYKKIQSKGITGVQKRDKNKSITWFFEVNPDAYIETSLKAAQ